MPSKYHWLEQHFRPGAENNQISQNFTNFNEIWWSYSFPCVLQFLQVSSKSDKKQKSFINSQFFCSEIQSVDRIVKIVHSENAEQSPFWHGKWDFYDFFLKISFFLMYATTLRTLNLILRFSGKIKRLGSCDLTPLFLPQNR